MIGLLQQIRQTIRRERLLPQGARVLVALSGGPDSVALTHILLELAVHGGFSVGGLAHFNHQLRPTADRDEAFCRDLAARLGLDFAVDRADVAAYARSQRLSVEDAARRLRYAFLERAAEDHRADHIAVGHTLDDQAETMLLKLIRGAGATGLGGISPRKGPVVRPLLEVTKEELLGYLKDHGLEWMQDETNDEVSNPRNQLRHVVLPQLERTYPGAVRAIARAAESVRLDAEWIEQAATAVFRAVSQRTSTGLELDTQRLTTEPRAIVRRVLLMALRAVSGDREIGLDHIRAAEGVLDRSSGGTDVPGARLELHREKLVLSLQGPFPK
jgi:tRNA(Ile)-lysidine synthase